jgi:methyl-accepting chemotaxis protein
MNFRSMRLSTRLFMAFGVVLLMSMLTSGFSLWKLSAIEGNLTAVVTDNNVRIKLNQQMSESVHIVSRVMRTVVLLTNEAEKNNEHKKIIAARAAYDTARADLEKFPVTPEARALREEVDEACVKARGFNTKVIDLGLANSTLEATALLMKDAAPSTQHWQDTLDKLIALQEKHNDARYAASQQDYSSARGTMIIGALVNIVLAVVLALLVVRSIVSELGGEPADVAELARSVAGSDLTTMVRVQAGDTTSVLAGMARMQTSLSEIVNSVRGNAESVATASAQIAQGNLDLSARTEQQASALQQTAASMEQLSSTVKQNSDNARQANQLALGASSVAVKGGEVVAQVVDTMKGINDSSKRIVDIIAVIDGIAFQTNILALNAAVEAARAGEQGRGFAVVASEVRNLAQRSAAAAKEIKGLITESVERVGQGTALVDTAGETMYEIVTSIKRVTDIVGEISAASVEQATGVAQVGEAVTQMDQATQQNSALVEESAAAAESLSEQAKALVAAVAIFRIGHTTSAPIYAATQVAAPVSSKPVLVPKTRAAAKFTERRSPDRAKNVTRPAFGKPGGVAPKTPAPKASKPPPTRAESAASTTATGEWETF